MEQQTKVALALPKSRIRAFVINPKSARKFFAHFADSKAISEMHSRAEAFKNNNLSKNGPVLVKK